MSIERKLAAIMFTDIAGYTEQMSKDQDVAFSLLETKQKTLRPLIKKHNGTLVKEMGDGTLSHFPSAIDASNCSIELQKSIENNNNLNVRVGVHLGDTMFKDDDIFGDGVNIASRLESISPAGGVLVSKNVYDELSSKKGYDGISLGLQSLKGVGRLVEVFALKDKHLTVPNPEDYSVTKIKVHSDKEVPSIAIIPFENKGADEDVFYSYGISIDLISDVSNAGLIRVASKKQIDDAGNVPQDELAKKLDVRYMTNGELWRMGDIFQLSIELYDTKNKKVVWSDRWQEKWDNLPIIKMNLSDGLLKALDTTSKVGTNVETTNAKAYEFYLKAKHKYEKRENTDDTEIAKELLNKALELDENLISAKILLGNTYRQMGDYDKAMSIYIPALKQAEAFGNKHEMGISLNSIGNVYREKSEYDKALDYYKRSLEIQEEISDKHGMGIILNSIGIVCREKGEYYKALDFYKRSLEIREEFGDKRGIGIVFNSIGIVYHDKGDYEKAHNFYERSLAIQEEFGDKRGMGYSLNSIGVVYYIIGDYNKAIDYHERSLKVLSELGDKRGVGNTLGNIGNVYKDIDDLNKALAYYDKSLTIFDELGDKIGIGITLVNIGIVHHDKGEYDKAKEYLEKSLSILKETVLGSELPLWINTYLYLTYKHLNKKYNVKEIQTLIIAVEKIEFELNFQLYRLLEDKSYLGTAYNQVQQKTSIMEKELKSKFLEYKIPRKIVEEWEKVE